MGDRIFDVHLLDGIRVFDLGIAIAGPMCARYLAHFGAEVIRVESRDRLDTIRTFVSNWLPPERYGRDVMNDTSPGMGEYNAGKRSLGLNLKASEGLVAAKRLLSKCDVFVSNYTQRAVKSLGLDYESVRAVSPDIIYILLTGYGASPGPYSGYLAWGKNLVSLAGLDDLTGWADRPPAAITGVAIADHFNGLFGATAVMAALDYRQRTGEGQFIDLSQFEAVASLLGPQLLDHITSGHHPERTGNRVEWSAPQGVYPCRGNDRWVAISALKEEEWQALCRVAEHLEWTDDPRFVTVQGRLAHHDELDARISAWTSQHTNSEVAEWLQRDGVPAAPVLDQPGLMVDPHLLARNFWVLADSTRFGKDLVTGIPVNLTVTPGHIARAAPALGEDNGYVLGQLCGYSEAEIAALSEKDAVYSMVAPNLKLERPYLHWIRHFMPDLSWPEE